jgi:hypothetical protein
MEQKVLCFLEIAVGIVAAFAVWSYVTPYFGPNATPSA